MSVMWVKPMSEIPWVVAGLRASDIEAKLLSDKMPTTPVLVPGRLEVSADGGTSSDLDASLVLLSWFSALFSSVGLDSEIMSCG